jgi:hypothetical protein
MSDIARTRDELKAAAYKLAALEGRPAAERFLEQLAREISDADWNRR